MQHFWAHRLRSLFVCVNRGGREGAVCCCRPKPKKVFFISVPPSVLPFSFFVPASPLLFDKKSHIRSGQCSAGIFDVVFVFFPFPIIIPLGLRSQFWHSIEASLCNQRSPTFLREEQNTAFVQDTSGGDPLRQVRDKMEKEEEESCIKRAQLLRQQLSAIGISQIGVGRRGPYPASRRRRMRGDTFQGKEKGKI